MNSPEKPAGATPMVMFYKTKLFYLAIVLVAVAATPILVYFAMSFNSVNGTVVELVTGHRTYQPGSLMVYLEVHVWSLGTSIDTRVQSPAFSLDVDSFNLGSVSDADDTFKPNGYIVYFLTFATTDDAIASAIGQAVSNRLVISMNALVSSGLYSAQVGRTASATWIWTN